MATQTQDVVLGQSVWMRFWGADVIVMIIGIRHSMTKVKYDVECTGNDGKAYRMYNVDGNLIVDKIPLTESVS